MLRLLADENFNNDIVRGLLLRQPDFDVVRVQDVGLSGVDDPGILAWAAANNRIILTHDHKTMPDHACHRMVAGDPVPGVFVISDHLPVGQAIQEILLMAGCSEHAEWNGRVVRVPV